MRQFSSLLFVFLLFILGGCSSATNNQRPVTVMGGRVIGIPFGNQGPLPAKGNGYQVLTAGPTPGIQERQLIYQFALSTPPASKLQRVEVDDISEEQHSPLVDDPSPWLTEGIWRIDTAPIKADDPRLAWIYTVTPTMRVYRFTITDTTGQQTVLYQAAGFPDFFKSMIRQKWGEKY